MNNMTTDILEIEIFLFRKQMERIRKHAVHIAIAGMFTLPNMPCILNWIGVAMRI